MVVIFGDIIAGKNVVFWINSMSRARTFLAARVLFIQIPQFSVLSHVNTKAKDNSSFLQLRKP